ncbi:uncharacterized protein [Lepeophtheirus salmonis]|uniref:uncharacterized protein n=1 Tax=Lepeophtheirus salmonis TaxID=72036 RepID=UPI001AEB1968|nr:uncharacterized protein LOC121115878 [Lepeophtheirus salmonis]
MHSSTQIASLISLIFLLGVAFSLPAERSPSPSNAHYDMIQEEGQRDRGPNSNLEWLLASDIGHRAEKRGFGISDPRSLFANIYGNYGNYVGYRKRLNIPTQSEVSSYYYGPTSLALASRKRGLGDRYDPRNLFRAIYGYRK